MTTQKDTQPASFPLPDLPACVEMQMGILSRMTEIKQAKADGKPVVWCSMFIPKEIIYAMDVPAMYLEVLAGQASILGLAGTYCRESENTGLSRDVCAVHRTSLGMARAASLDPFFENLFVPPDLAIGSSYPCLQEGRGFRFIEEQYGCPSYFIDAPLNAWGEAVPDYAVEYFAGQLEGVIHFLEEHGYKLDWNRLKEEVAFTKELGIILAEIESYRMAVPCPMGAFDSFILCTSPYFLPAAMRKLELFQKLRDQVKERVERGVGVVGEEKLRLLWVGGAPPTCDFALLNYPERYGAVVVKTTSEFLVGFPFPPELLDAEKPLLSIARAMLSSPNNPLYRCAIDWIVQQAKEYRIDGVVSTVERTCSLIPGLQRLAKDAIFKETGVPSVVFDVNGVDEREYDRAAACANLDSFIQGLLAGKTITA